MIPYPNIIILHQKKEIAFYDNTSKIVDHSYVNSEAKNYLKFKKILKNSSNLILIMHTDYQNLSQLNKFIKSNNIKKIYFFIDDIFRITHPTVGSRIQTYILEKDLNNCRVEELEIVNRILHTTNITDYEIFHCEYKISLVEKKYNVKFKYFDIFLSNYEVSRRNYTEYSKTIKNKVCCFNHREEPYRHIISSLLHNKKDCIVTYANKYELSQILGNQELPIKEFNNKDMIKKSLEEFDSANLFFIKNNQFVSMPDNKSSLYLDPQIQHDQLILNTIQDSFVNLVSETRFSSLSAYVSEKSLKPIYMCRPFILLSSAGTLSLLKKLGFKTFNQWWDESYDLEPNHAKRFEMVYEIIEKILTQDISQLNTMLIEMEPILKHNRDNLKNITKNMCLLN